MKSKKRTLDSSSSNVDSLRKKNKISDNSVDDIIVIEDSIFNKSSNEIIELSEDDNCCCEDTDYQTVIDPGIRLNHCRNLSAKFNKTSLMLEDIMSDETLNEVYHFNYMIDVDYLIRCTPASVRSNIKLTLVATQLYNIDYNHENLKFTHIEPKLPFMYGTHHSKIMFLFYKDESLRIIIHTSNIIEGDWLHKTQAMWVSPKLVIKDSIKNENDILEKYNFKKSICDYLKGYNEKKLDNLINSLSKYDYNPCKVILIGSIPGKYMGSRINNWGHMKLRSVIRDICSDANGELIIAQFSSVGSFTDKWLSSEFFSSLKGLNQSEENTNAFNKLFKNTASSSTPSVKCKIVYPTVENVRNSCEGWLGGSCLPYSQSNWTKQKEFIVPYMSEWKSDDQGRSNCMPHIKTYTRLSKDGKTIDWHVLTSSNLSKAAWGQLEKKATQITIRSYELGVFISPELFKVSDSDDIIIGNIPITSWKDDFTRNRLNIINSVSSSIPNKVKLDLSMREKQVVALQMPYDIPLLPYKPKDEAFTKDKDHLDNDIYNQKFNDIF